MEQPMTMEQDTVTEQVTTTDGIRAPVLLLVGELTTTPLALEGLDELERALPEARRAIIPGQRHLANVFAPQALAGLIESFLDSTPTLSPGAR